VYPTRNPSLFIAELHRRYSARHPRRAREADHLPPGYQAPPPESPPDAIFLSYAREDLVAVQSLYGALCEAGIPVWFDMERLEVGDEYRSRIFRAIDSAILFIPVISRAALDRRPRFFRLEWKHAAGRISMYPPDRPYVVPVVVDDLPLNEIPVPDGFLDLQITRLLRGAVSAQFLAAIRRKLAGIA
jgi:hypothetical protein